MAPTICDDDLESCSYQNCNRLLRHHSVISYVGRQTNRENEVKREMVSNERDIQQRRCREFVPFSSENRNTIKYLRRMSRMSYESDDNESSDSIPSPMAFHNYAKRQKFNDSDDESERYISTSSVSNENSVSSTLSFNNDLSRQPKRMHYSHNILPVTPFSPVSSTTDAMSLYCRYSKVSANHVNPFYRQDLMEIAMKTIILLQKNRSLHAKLNQLKLETSEFVNSVMSNPENAKLRRTINQSNEKTIEHPTPKVLGVKNK